MKHLTSLLLLGLALLTGCTKTGLNRSKDFTHTGCAAETRAGLFGDEPSLLKLKYEDGGLRVIRTNVQANCAIKIRGLSCTVSIQGNTIRYMVDYETDGPEADCICPVDEMSSVVTGLEEGKEYTFHYNGVGRCREPVTFTFRKGLNQVYDVATL